MLLPTGVTDAGLAGEGNEVCLFTVRTFDQGESFLGITAEDKALDYLFLVFLNLHLMTTGVSRPMSSEEVEVDAVLIIPRSI